MLNSWTRYSRRADVARHCLLQQSQHRRRLVKSFLVLILKLGVGDDAAAGREADNAARIYQRADRDVEIHVAVIPDITDRAAIDAAPVRFELLDDLHCAQLRRAGNRSPRETTA